MKKLNKEEKSAIRRLKSLAKVWPKTLWLFSGNGELYVMKKNEKQQRVYHSMDMSEGGGVDAAYVVSQIAGIENDGGDW